MIRLGPPSTPFAPSRPGDARRLPTAAVPLAAALLVALPLSAQEPAALPAGEVMGGQTGFDGAAAYTFEATTAGILTVVARGDEDLVLSVTDTYGQPLPDGRSDQDLGGDRWAEQVAVTLTRPGTYQVRIETFGSSTASDFEIGAGWLPFPAVETAPDPDGSPGSATELEPGEEPHADVLNGAAGDFRDWYVVRPDRAGTLTVTTRAEDGDLVLEAFETDAFGDPLERSDQDLQDRPGNEALTLVVEAGEVLYFKVAPWSDGAAVEYRIQAGFIPQ